MSDSFDSQGSSSGFILPGKPERALKHEFIPRRGGPPEFRYCQGDWAKSVVHCVIDDLPFAEGTLRSCYRMQLVNKDSTRHNVVAKVSKDPSEDRNTYYRDVQAQMCSKLWAVEFNALPVPKKIDFVPAYVFELVDRPGRPLIGVEEFVEGVFVKHNNNVGGTVGDTERATPNAFSHFTWEASNRTMLVCDIQGVDDVYTDPQIHTASGKGFGRGNLGQAGVHAFLARHRCTQICDFLGLQSVGAATRWTADASGSVPERRGTPCGGMPPSGLSSGQDPWPDLMLVGQSLSVRPGGAPSPSKRVTHGPVSEIPVELGPAPTSRHELRQRNGATRFRSPGPPHRSSDGDDDGDDDDDDDGDGRSRDRRDREASRDCDPELSCVGGLDVSDDALMEQIMNELDLDA